MKDRIFWAPSKTFEEGGEKKRLRIEVTLNDCCRNGHHDFAITGEVFDEYRKNPSAWGAIHEIIVEHFPELEKFIPLHCCNYLGHPLYPVENGQYFVREEGKEVAMRQLRITEEEYGQLELASDKEEKLYFKYLLYSLGIVDRWKKEADEFIAFLEEKTGEKWEYPYKPEQERNVMHLTTDERKEVESKIAEGYYTKEALAERKAARYKAAQDAIRNKVIERYEEAERKAREERDVMLYLFDNGMPIDNVIFYDHTKKVVFNWLDYKPMVSQEQFVDFVNRVDYSKLPEGVTFHLGKDDK